MLILDTDHISFLERVTHTPGNRLSKRLADSGQVVVATIVSFEEQCRGWLSVLAQAKKISDEILAYRRLSGQLQNYCSMRVLEFEERAAIEFQSLRAAKIRVGTLDLKIAAIALAHQATLLSRNLRDFHKVPGLRVEDWTT